MSTEKTETEVTHTNQPAPNSGLDDSPCYAVSDADLRESIQLVRDLMGRSGSKTAVWDKLEKHLFDLLDIQTKRAAMIIFNCHGNVDSGIPSDQSETAPGSPIFRHNVRSDSSDLSD